MKIISGSDLQYQKQRFHDILFRRNRWHQQTGAALFLILIAVALFAALSYAITQSGRGDGGGTSKEQALIAAAQFTQAGAALKAGFDRMMLGGGVTAESIRIPAASSCFGECTSGTNCLFAPDGGGVAKPNFPSYAETHPAAAPGYYPATGIWRCYVGVNDSFVGAANGVTGVGANATGTPPNSTGSDAIIYVGWLKQDVCQAINTGLGISGIPSQGSHASAIYSAAPGQRSACVTFSNCAGCYIYYHVLNEN